MELITFLIIILVIFLVYYMTDTVRALTKELKEIKTKCIENGNTSRQDFKIHTEDPLKSMNDNLLEKIEYFKVFFDK